MMSPVILLVLSALGALACRRIGVLKRNPWAVGVVFGLLAVVSDFLAVEVDGWWVLSRGAFPMAAALCFGARTGLVSGVMAAAWSLIAYGLFYPGAESVAGAVSWCVSMLVMTLYALVIRKVFIMSRHPDPFSAFVFGAFGVTAYFSVDVCVRSGSMATVVEIVRSAALPETALYALVSGTVAAICWPWRDGFRDRRIAGNMAMAAVFAVGFVLLAHLVFFHADEELEGLVGDAQRRLEHDIDDQIGFELHCDAVSMVEALQTVREHSQERMAELAWMYDVDEVTIAGRDGVVRASSDAKALAFDFKSHPATAEFMALADGTAKFVKQRFRHSASDSEFRSKYIGVPFRDGSGFLELGYSQARMERDFETFFFPMLVDMSVGGSGYYVVANGRTGRVANDAAGHAGIVGKSLAEIGLVPEGGEGVAADSAFDARVFGRLSRCRVHRVGDWNVYIVVPFAVTYGSALQIALFGGLLLLVFCIIFREALNRFLLAREKIDSLRRREDVRREKDLALARTIQYAALPSRFPEEDDFRIFARMDAAKVVGGDFYDFFTLPSGEIGFLVADVSGKSVPGAMFMMQAKMVIRSCLFGTGAADLAAAVSEANVRLCENNTAEMFVTAWIGAYDRKTGRVRYVSAGHNPPLVKRADGTVEWVRTRPGMPLAAIEVAKYRVETLALGKGDTLLVYTDGVTEATNAALELYGEERLEAAVRASDAKSVDNVRADVDRFVAGAEQADDITLLAFDVK